MNVLVVDTSTWISFFRGSSVPTLELALKEGRAYLTVVVAAELLSSFKPESKREDFIAFLRELPLCDASLEHWVRVGNLRSSLAKRGFAVSTPDAHVAQSAIDLECYLLSEDKIFAKFKEITGLKLATKSE